MKTAAATGSDAPPRRWQQLTASIPVSQSTGSSGLFGDQISSSTSSPPSKLLCPLVLDVSAELACVTAIEDWRRFFFYITFSLLVFFSDTLVTTEARKHHLPAAHPAPLCIYEYSTSINLFVECSHLRRGAQKSHYLSQEVCARTSVRGMHVGRGGLN